MNPLDGRAAVTWLYTPAIRDDLMGKALRSGADAILFDLEDSVVPERKDEARVLLQRQLNVIAETPNDDRPQVHVRVNGPRTTFVRDDLAAVADHPILDGIRVPKVEHPDDVVAVIDLLPPGASPRLLITCALETAAGIEQAYPIATAHARVGALTLGESDLRRQLRLGEGDAPLAPLRSRVVVAARAAGLPAPVMSAYPNIHDLDGLAASCRSGRALGMFGRTALTPRHLATIAAAFTPSEDEIATARSIVTAADHARARGEGSIALEDGQFIDEPIIAAARSLLDDLPEPPLT